MCKLRKLRRGQAARPRRGRGGFATPPPRDVGGHAALFLGDERNHGVAVLLQPIDEVGPGRSGEGGEVDSPDRPASAGKAARTQVTRC